MVQNGCKGIYQMLEIPFIDEINFLGDLGILIIFRHIGMIIIYGFLKTHIGLEIFVGISIENYIT